MFEVRRQGWLLPFYRPSYTELSQISFLSLTPTPCCFLHAAYVDLCICFFIFLTCLFASYSHLQTSDKSASFSAILYLEPGTGLGAQYWLQLSINLINIHYSHRIWSIIHLFGNFRSGENLGYIMSRYQVYHKADNSYISPWSHTNWHINF